jgi:FKBP-type peptidyl-prolyl cis-trans isomerase 2
MIADQKVVSLNYTVKDTEGQVVDSSEGAAPALKQVWFLLPKLKTARFN